MKWAAVPGMELITTMMKSAATRKIKMNEIGDAMDFV